MIPSVLLATIVSMLLFFACIARVSSEYLEEIKLIAIVNS